MIDKTCLRLKHRIHRMHHEMADLKFEYVNNRQAETF